MRFRLGPWWQIMLLLLQLVEVSLAAEQVRLCGRGGSRILRVAQSCSLHAVQKMTAEKDSSLHCSHLCKAQPSFSGHVLVRDFEHWDLTQLLLCQWELDLVLSAYIEIECFSCI